MSHAQHPQGPSDWQAFLLDEAALLDARQFEAWAGCFSDDGWYWMPTNPQDTDPSRSLSIFHEPRSVLALRARRLSHPMTHVEIPASRTHHHVSGMRLITQAPHELTVESMQLVVTLRSGEQRLFSTRMRHELVRDAKDACPGWRIRLKRVELLDGDCPQRAMPFPL